MGHVSAVLLGLGVAVAVVAAIRSTWSPCGVSMLSTLTPLAERSRGHRFAATATWFIVGATAGGATLGLLAAGLALAVRATGVTDGVALGLAAAAALVTAGSDLAPFGVHLPTHGRQVDELWLGRYRRWVYASGFGWQIGTGLATYIVTAAVYLLVVLGALGADPVAALALGTLFGLLRGLAVLLSVRITTPEALHAFHRRFDAWGPASRLLAIGVQLAVAVVAGLAAGPVVATVAAAAVVVLVLAGLRPGSRRRPGARPTGARPTGAAPATAGLAHPGAERP
jgi:hypothetical protein